MPRLRELLIRLWQTLRPGSGDRDLEEELRLHRELAAEDARRGADSPEQAARASRIQSGAMAPAMEALRDQHTLPWLRDLSQDTRYAIRTLRRAPGFAGVVILTLALGIGANTAIFSVIKTVLLRPLPYPDADRVVWVVENIPATEPGGTVERFAPIELSMLADFRAQTSMLDAVGAHSGTIMTLMGRAEPILLQGSQMSPDMFAILGARAALGRTFLAAEERPGADPVVVLSSVAWRAYFGGDPTILGQSAVLDGTTYTVVGVMGPDFRFPDPRTAFWIPLPVGPTLGRSLRVRPVARLAEGVALSQASAEISTLLYRLRDISPAEDLMMDFTRYEVIPVQDEIAASSRLAVLMLAAATAAVFLIGGINVAHLLVARTLTRRRELAVRASLGASRGRVIRQLLVENVGLAAIGGVAGLGVAHGSLTVVKTIGASLPRRDLSPSLTLPRVEELALDPSALVFGLVLAVLTGIACGLAPALSRSRAQWMRRHLSGVDTRSGLAAIGPHRVRGSLVVAEVALATTLLIAGALLMQSFVMQARVDPGFDADNVVTFQARLPFATTRAESPALAHAMEERLAALPRVHSVGYASRLPMGGGRSGMALKPPESPAPHWPADARPPSLFLWASPEFFATMDIDILDGRAFSPRPRTEGPQEILVNQAFVRTGYLGESPIGRIIYTRGDLPLEVVGIVADVRQFGLDQEPEPEAYRDARAGLWLPGMVPNFVVRVDQDPAPVLSSLRGILAQVDSRAALDGVATMNQIVSNSISGPRLYAVLLGTFAGVAVLLAVIGVYGLVTFTVGRRTHEIGVRMALGADRFAVLRLVLRQSIATTMLGIVLGLAGAAAVTRSLESLLFGLGALDRATYGGVAVLFVSVATLAAFIPARRATRIDPTTALRAE